MTDLSKHTLAEIERRKSEPDWAAWEPKLDAFCASFGGISLGSSGKRLFIRALIAAHNTPLAGEWTEWFREILQPANVSLETHEIEVFIPADQKWLPMCTRPSWFSDRYRYRPRQS